MAEIGGPLPDAENKPVIVSANAGLIDLLTALGRYLAVIAATIPILLTVLGTHDVIAIIAYFQSADGAKLIAAVVGLGTLVYGLYKTHWRGAQMASVAGDPRVPNRVAALSK